MESIQTKIIQKSLQKLIYIPNMLKFTFPEFQILQPFDKLDFLQKRNLLSYNSHKLIPFEDLKSIFTEMNDIIQNEVLKENDQIFNEDILKAINSFKKFISELAEDKYYLNFTQFENLLILLEKCQNLKFIYLILQIFSNIFSIRTRYCEEMLITVTDIIKNKFLLLLNCWFLNINLGNNKSVKIDDIIENNNLEDYCIFDLSQFSDLLFEQATEETFKIENNIRKFNVEKNIFIDLRKYILFNDHVLILNTIFEETKKKVHENSILSQILKMRMLIIKNIYDFKNGKFIEENKLYLIFCGMYANLILNQSKKLKEFKEKQNILCEIINFRFYEEHKVIPIKKFTEIFKLSHTEETQEETLILLYMHYDYLDLKKESYLEFENFLKKLFMNVHHNLLAEQGIFVTQLDEKKDLNVLTSDRIIHQLLVILWRFFEEEIEGVVSNKYSNTIDIIINIAKINSDFLEKNYDEGKLLILLKIIILIKNEIHKDKEIVFLDILMDLFNKHISLYNFYYDKIKNYPNVINIYTQFLFELIEALFFYFIDPAKPNLLHSIPRISREILENDIWSNKDIFSLVREKRDPGFLQVFNVIISFINDLFLEVPENLISSILEKFQKTGLIDLIHEEFLMNNIPSDFDLLSFYIKFLSLIFLHKREFLPEEKLQLYLSRVFELILNKEMICKNIRRFLSAYVNETLKNLAEEMVILLNSVPQINDFILMKIFELEDKLTDVENYVTLGLIQATNEQELISYFNRTPHFIKALGWFNYNEKSTKEDFYDDFYLLQKNIYNIWKLYTKFFDHHRTNFYKKFFEGDISKDRNIFDFIFKRKLVHLNEISKVRKIHTLFIKNLISTNNTFSKAKLISYLKSLLIESSNELKEIFDQSTDEELKNTAFFLNKYNFQTLNQEFDLDLSKLTSNTFNLINLYMRILSIADCIKYQVSTNMDENLVHFFSEEEKFQEFINYYKNMNVFVVALFEQTREYYYESLFLKMDSMLAENYIMNSKVSNHINMSNIFLTIQNNCSLSISSINIELFYLIYSKMKNIDKSQFYWDFFKGHDFSLKIEALLQNKPDDFGIVYLNSLINHYIYILINDGNDFRNFINSSLYNLSKKQFFSKNLVSSIQFVVDYINDKNKDIRKLLIKKEIPENEINIKEISLIYLLDEATALLFKNISKILTKLFSETVISKVQDFEDKNVSSLKIKNVIEKEKMEVVKNLTTLFKNLPPNCLLNLAFLERKAPAKDPKKNLKKSIKEEQKEIGLKVDKMNILKGFLESYRQFFDSIFSFLIPKNFEVRIRGLIKEDKTFDPNDSDSLLRENIVNPLFNTLQQDINNYIKNVFEKNGNKMEEENEGGLESIKEITEHDKQILDETKEIKEFLVRNLEDISKYFFVNFLKYKEIYKNLVSFWSKYVKYETEIKKNSFSKSLIEMIDGALIAVKSISGIKEKNPEVSMTIEIKNPRDALFYLLKLHHELKIQIKTDIKDEKKKYVKNNLNFFFKLLEDIFTKKYNLKRVQDPINVILEILMSLDLIGNSKMEVLIIINKLFEQHNNLLKNKTKEKSFLINDKIFKRIFELMAKLMNQDEQFIEKMINFKDKNFIRNIFRLEVKDISKNQIKELNVHFRTFVEKIVRQPHLIQILFESEIKNYFFNKEDVFLKKFSQNFENYIESCENIFTFQTKKICNIKEIQSIKDQEDTHKIELKPEENKGMKNYEVKPFINDFIFLLIKDLIYKLNKRSKYAEHNFVFNDIFISDIIFFQLMPRYPMFYMIKTKEKIPFTIFFFEKILNLHWGYLAFFEPLLYSSHFLIENEKKDLISVTDLLQVKINGSLLEMLEDITKEIELKNVKFLKLMNINIYILNLLKSGNTFEKHQEFFKEILKRIEAISILFSQLQLIQPEYFLTNLGVSEVMRRFQIIELMNKSIIKEISSKANTSSFLVIPKTFTYNLRKWSFQSKINQDQICSIRTKSIIDYTNFSMKFLLSEEYKQSKDKIRIYFQNEINDLPRNYRSRIININSGDLNHEQEGLLNDFQIIGNNNNIINNENEEESDEESQSESSNSEREEEEFLQNHNFPPPQAEGDEEESYEDDSEEENEEEDYNEEIDFMEIENFNEGVEEEIVDYNDDVIEDDYSSSNENSDNNENEDDDEEEEVVEEDENGNQFVEIEEYEEDMDDEMSSQSENLTISHNSTVFQSQNYLVNVKEEFFSKKLFEKYPYAFPLNLTNKIFVFLDDKINFSYQNFIVTDVLNYFRKEKEDYYHKCEKEFAGLDFKQWDNKYIMELKKKHIQPELLLNNQNHFRVPFRNRGRRMGNDEHLRTLRDNSYDQYSDIVNRRNNRAGLGEFPLLTDLDDKKEKFNLYEELKKTEVDGKVIPTTQEDKMIEEAKLVGEDRLIEEEISQSKNKMELESQKHSENPISNYEEFPQTNNNLDSNFETPSNNISLTFNNANSSNNRNFDISNSHNIFEQLSQVENLISQMVNNNAERNLPNEFIDNNQTGVNNQAEIMQNSQGLLQFRDNPQENQMELESLNHLMNDQNQHYSVNQNSNFIIARTENIENREENIGVSENIMSEEHIEPEFNFPSLGLPNNFLEIAEIDPTFFYALPADLQAELAIQHGEALNIRTQPQQTPANNQNPPVAPNRGDQEDVNPENPLNPEDAHNESLQDDIIEVANNNMIFLSSLAPDIREDVLMTCPDEFLLSLTPEIQEEARRLRTTRIINNDFYFNNQIRNQSQHNTIENRLKKSLEGNKQKDLINKIYPARVYEVDNRLLEVFKMIEDKELNLNNIPLGLLSALMFDEEIQNGFYQKIFLNEQLPIITRYLLITEKLTYSNFQFFQKKENFDKLLEFLLKYQNETLIITIILKILIHITQTSVSFVKKQACCSILITKRNLQCLTSTNYIKSSNFPISEYLSRILMILSFNKDNLKTIIDNLKDNISIFAFNLNLNLDNILKTKKENKNYLEVISKIASNNYDSYMKFLKLFKLVEQLFTKSFNLNLEDEKKSIQDKKKEIEDDKFEKIKEKVLNEFSNYFDDSTIKNVFAKLFRIIFIFEKDIDELLKKKTFSKPVFFQFLPLIEAFFICYKILYDDETFQNIKKKYKFKKKNTIEISKYKDKIESEEESQSEKEIFLKNEVLDVESIFYQACRKNKKVLNYMMTKIPRLADSSLRIIISKAPKIISFDLKRKYFNQRINDLKIHHTLKLKIRRDNLFTDSFTQIISKNPIDLRMKLHIKFVDEEGEDAGGLTRAWFQKLGIEIFNPDYVLFKPAAHGYAFQPNPNSSVHLEHLKYFKFIGRIIGKALFEGQLLDAHFTTSFYKHMVGADLSYLDFQDYDPDYFKTLKWILENDVTELDLSFSYETDHFGKTISKPLKDNGENILVDNQNKEEYIKLLCYAKMADEIKLQIEAFLEGLNDVVPADLIRIFTAQELELMISGLPEIDIEDLRKNTEYVNYTKDSLVIQNFWSVMKNFDQNLKAGFLQFVTGTSKVPLEGFRTLKGMGGEIQKFQIHRAYDKKKLPTSHTCMNQLDLPEYDTREDLENKLKTAIIFGKDGFGFL